MDSYYSLEKHWTAARYGIDEFIDLPARTVWWTEDGGQARSENISPTTTPQGKLAAQVSEAEL